MEIVIGVILLIAAVFLIIAVLMQNGQQHKVGAIQGGAETFFGKTKGSAIDKLLNRLTTIVAIVFCVIVIIMYVFQDDVDYSSVLDAVQPGTQVEIVDDTAEAVDTTAAAE
ncbi:MAG: preprotein translocase subunit SecG [Clostridia bacterium]|nr:preprotein translocase subunit SecG [Clostridia bacterium]